MKIIHYTSLTTQILEVSQLYAPKSFCGIAYFLFNHLANTLVISLGIGGYLRASYFSLVALSTVGYGDMAPKNIVEISFVGVFGLIGGLILPAVIGGISVYILNFGMLAKSFR